MNEIVVRDIRMTIESATGQACEVFFYDAPSYTLPKCTPESRVQDIYQQLTTNAPIHFSCRTAEHCRDAILELGPDVAPGTVTLRMGDGEWILRVTWHAAGERLQQEVRLPGTPRPLTDLLGYRYDTLGATGWLLFRFEDEVGGVADSLSDLFDAGAPSINETTDHFKRYPEDQNRLSEIELDASLADCVARYGDHTISGARNEIVAAERARQSDLSVLGVTVPRSLVGFGAPLALFMMSMYLFVVVRQLLKHVQSSRWQGNLERCSWNADGATSVALTGLLTIVLPVSAVVLCVGPIYRTLLGKFAAALGLGTLMLSVRCVSTLLSIRARGRNDTTRLARGPAQQMSDEPG